VSTGPAMGETDRIVDQLQRMYDGDAWHGPSVRAALHGVDATMAAARPVPHGHTISEIVVHMTAWTREVTRRLQTGVARDPEDGDWSVANVTGAAAWDAAVAALDAANAELVRTIAASDDARLQDRISDAPGRAPGRGVSRYTLLHGLVQHHAYHAGQISLLKKALAR
jgi:uncharacterized damage-inducible protein DinB